MNVRYRVELETGERRQLEKLVAGGSRAVRKIKRAQILLAAAAGSTDEEIARTVQVGTSTVYCTKRRFVEESLEQALAEDPRPGGRRKLAAAEEVMLVALACSTPPAGRATWTLALLAGAMVRLTPHAQISRHTIGRRLAENEIGILASQCLDRRIPDLATLTAEVEAWVCARNAQGAAVQWMFGIEQARAKLGRAYPTLATAAVAAA